MLAKNPSPRLQKVYYGLSFPIALGLMVLFSFRLIDNPLSNAIQKADTYVHELAEITVNAHFLDKITSQDRSTPYIFYWGLIQANIEYDNVNDQYFGTVHTSYNTFSECVRREPRLWNGNALEPELSFRFLGQEIGSRVGDRSAYAPALAILDTLSFNRLENQSLQIGKIRFPDGKYGTVTLILDEKDPKWLMRSSLGEAGKIEPNAGRGFSYIQWGNKQFTPAFHQYCTATQLLDLMKIKPYLINGDARQLNDFALRVVNGNQTIVPLRDVKTSGWSTYPEIQAEMNRVSMFLQPGTVVTVYVNLGPTGSEFAVFTLVDENDNRLNPDLAESANYFLSWGNYGMFGRIPQGYATEYFDHSSGKDTVYYLNAAQYFGLEGLKYTPDELGTLLNQRIVLKRGDKAVDDYHFDLSYQDKKMTIINGVFTEEQQAWLKANLKPKTMLKFNRFSGKSFDLNKVYINIDVVKEQEIKEKNPDFFLNEALKALERKIDPIPTLCGFRSGTLLLTDITSCNGLSLRKPDDQPSAGFEITSYAVTILPKNQDPVTLNMYHAEFNRDLKLRIKEMLVNGGGLFFDDIVVKNLGTQEVRNVGGIAFKIN